MLKKTIIFISVSLLCFPALSQDSQGKIVSVKIFQNQAAVEREAKVRLKKGENIITLTGFPRELQDWSVKGALPKGVDAKIMSLQVEQKMLLERFQKKVGDIELKLRELGAKDRIYIDELSSLKAQEKFVDSVLGFSSENAQKELMTRIPQVKVWDDTLSYCTSKKKAIGDRRREIENLRESLGKEIQKYEFELSQIAGQNYYNNYRNVYNSQMKKKAGMEVQQFADSNAFYGQQQSLLNNPGAGTDIEKNVILSVYSSREADAKITVSYMIPRTNWAMLYDFRANHESGTLGITVYGDIYQKTGEDWNDIQLVLSTGSPGSRPGTPLFTPWYLSPYEPVPVNKKSYRSEAMAAAAPKESMKADKDEEVSDEAPPIPETVVSEKGAYVEFSLPLAQTILSTDKRQKKLVKDYSLTAGRGLTYLYEAYTWHSREAFLAAEVTNTTDIPFLPGTAQVFIENEYYGLINVPYMLPGKKETIALGADPRISVDKTLVKKYEDTRGVFGGKTRIIYNYQINIENHKKETADIAVQDIIPVSQSEKIEIEVLNQTLQPIPAEGAEDTKYRQGLRKYKLHLAPGQKISIGYDLSISYDKEMNIRGLR